MELLEAQLWDKARDATESVTLGVSSAENGLVELSLQSGEKKKASEGDLFASLALIRESLEKSNQFILCNGSRIDVAPSRMSRQMGGGRKAYQLQKGKQALLEDLVDIFEPIKKEAVSTVAEQRSYYKKWINSLG